MRKPTRHAAHSRTPVGWIVSTHCLRDLLGRIKPARIGMAMTAVIAGDSAANAAPLEAPRMLTVRP